MPKSQRSWVYVLASRKNGTLYVGVTADIRRRVWQHKSGVIGGFTKQYRVTTLVLFEEFSSVSHAISREKQIKGWRRSRKIALIEAENPDWSDLAATWGEPALGLGPSHGSG
jgi:putative endonuclease